MTTDDPLFEPIWDDLRLFEKKIMMAIGRHIKQIPPKANAYTMHMVDFSLDHLNPSDITERMKRLKSKTVAVMMEDQRVHIPLLTDLRYEDLSKTVTFTFNSLLKPCYEALADLKLTNQPQML